MKEEVCRTSLKALRMKKGISQSQLAEKSGVCLKSIQGYESGRININNSSLLTLISLAGALDCGIRLLLEDESLKERVKAYEDMLYDMRRKYEEGK